MAERNLLISHDKGRFTTRALIGARQKRVVHVSANGLTQADGTGASPEPGLKSAPHPERTSERATDRAVKEPVSVGEATIRTDSPVSPLSPRAEGGMAKQDRESGWHRLRVPPVDGVELWRHDGPSDVRRYQLRRGNEVLEETSSLRRRHRDPGRTYALDWIASLQRGEVPTLWDDPGEPLESAQPAPETE